jgi:hypothetical protein
VREAVEKGVADPITSGGRVLRSSSTPTLHGQKLRRLGVELRESSKLVHYGTPDVTIPRTFVRRFSIRC